MQEIVQFKIPGKLLEDLLRLKEDREGLMAALLESNRYSIEQLLMAYYFSSRNRVFDLVIRNPQFLTETTGRFKLDYKLGHFYACADIDTQQDESMTVGFRLEVATSELVLQGEYWPERGPDEF